MKKYCLLFLLLFLLPISLKAQNCDFDFKLSVDNYAIFDLKDDRFICSSDTEKRISIASLTKIMTFIVTIEEMEDLSVLVPVTQNALNGLVHENLALVGFEVGEKIKALDLLYALLLPSSNDAAVILASYIGKGDINVFLEKMNQKAKELGCYQTHFTNPYGGDDVNHYSTMEDLYKIAKYAMKFPEFNEIVKTKQYTIEETQNCYQRTIKNTNGLLQDSIYHVDNTIGMKTGTTDDAGYCLISRNQIEEYDYLVLALGGNDELLDGKEVNGAFLASKNIYEWLYQNYERKDIINNDIIKNILPEIKVKNGSTKELSIVINETLKSILPINMKTEDLTYIWSLPDIMNAPISQNQKVGALKVLYKDELIGSTSLYAENKIEKKENHFILYCSLIIIFLLISFIFFILKMRKHKGLKVDK